MARPREIAPCKMKGRDPVRGKDFTGCECARAFICAGTKTGERISYGLSADGATVRLSDETALGAGTLIAAPCDEIFLKKNSLGTVRHLETAPEKTKFKGCYDAEKFLIEREMIRYEQRERLGRSLDSSESAELFARIADFGELNSDDLFSFFLEGSRRELGAADMHQIVFDANSWQEKLVREPASTGPSPSESFDGEPYDDELSEGAAAGALVEKLLQSLTAKQRNAIRAVFLDNFEKLPRAQIARRMGIREDSLMERVHGAFKKLRKSFPALVQANAEAMAKRKARAPAVIVRKKAEAVIRPGVDEEKVRLEAREWAAKRLEFEKSWRRYRR